VRHGSPFIFTELQAKKTLDSPILKQLRYNGELKVNNRTEIDHGADRPILNCIMDVSELHHCNTPEIAKAADSLRPSSCVVFRI
jgi:hypothetical protein